MSAPASKKARWTAAISAGSSTRSRADHRASERSCPRASRAVAIPPSVTRTVPRSGGPLPADSPRPADRSVLVGVPPVQLGQRLEGLLVALVDRDLQVRACLVEPPFVGEEAAEG